MPADFKKKRIEYLNNWPNVEPFEIERQYYETVDKVKNDNGTIFKPFQLKRNEDVLYNKTISFVIESMDQLEKYPNFSYEFIFKAYDCFIEHYYSSVSQITDKNKMLCNNEWRNILSSNSKLMTAFGKMISDIPVKACQYTYIRIFDKTRSNKAYQRVTTDISGGISSTSNNRKEFIDAIENKYGMDISQYANTIRNASMLYRYLLKNDSIIVDTKSYNITIEDKLHILVW